MTTKHVKRGNDMGLLLIVKKELLGRHVEVTLSTHESGWIGDARHALLEMFAEKRKKVTERVT